MGTYAELRIGDIDVLSSKSAPPSFAMTLFRSGDRSVRHDEDGLALCAYRISAALAKERLHVMGFTFDHARADYERCRAIEIEKLLADYEDEEGHVDESTLDSWDREALHFLKRATFDAFVAASRKIFASGLSAYQLKEHGDSDPIIANIAEFDLDFAWGFYSEDSRSLVRVLLELVPDDTLVVVDVTGLIVAGYFAEDDDLVALALAERRCTYAIDSPIVVLTEGITDAEVLSRSMSLLYPGLRHYYRFLDYAARPSGGASSLVSAVRAFVAAGIENRILALFDNDAEGHASLQVLRRELLPPNVRALAYADIDLARTYPTRGPTGDARQDVNGTAASIELYFGEDVLREPLGELTRVRWKSRHDGIGRYQGEVEQKDELKRRFLEKLARCERDTSLIDESSWREMRILLSEVFRAFQS